jgi:alpha-L-arabinofuranosidase
MITRVLFLGIVCLVTTASLSQKKNSDEKSSNLIIYADSGRFTISRDIYGQFSEHLGRCIYGGIWVGKDSKIPNTNGVRNDVAEALRQIKIPNLRWPGGCFADEYHWMDGIGSPDSRPKIVNTNWGGVTEDNSFGTHEFLNFCELIGTEPYISANVGSGSVEEMAKWVEYVNADGESPMANLRRANGRDKPWNVKYWGVGNESWGCGGSMRPEYYADLFRRYATYCRNYGDNHLFKIASGASDYNYNWTEILMQNVGNRMQGLSLHYYTVKGWNGSKGSATDFDMDAYQFTLAKCLGIEPVIRKHIAIMDKYDPEKKVGLMVDEWGTWYDVEPGTNPGFLYQQNTMRDAFVAALTLNIFHRYADRIKMANIAQLVNVLQALILTDGDKMVLTPTYHVFELYQVHKEGIYLPSGLTSDEYLDNEKEIPALSATSSRGADGTIYVSIVNVHPSKEIPLTCTIEKTMVSKGTARILRAADVHDYNSFDSPEKVTTKAFKDFKISDGHLALAVPARSILVFSLK